MVRGSLGFFDFLLALVLTLTVSPEKIMAKKIESRIDYKTKTITCSLHGVPTNLDPAKIKTSAEWHTLPNLGINLVSQDSHGKMIPSAAVAWTVADDSKVFEFELDPSLRASDGSSLDTSDWEATFKYLLANGGSTHSFISKYLDNDGIRVLSKTKFQLRLKAPYKTLLLRLGTPEFILLPKKSIKGSGLNLEVSSGAYFLAKYHQTEKEWHFKANKYYSGYSKEAPQIVIVKSRPKTTKDTSMAIVDGRIGFSIDTLLPTDPNVGFFSEKIDSKEIGATSVEPFAVAYVILRENKGLSSSSKKLAVSRTIWKEASKEFSQDSKATFAYQYYPLGTVGALPLNRAIEMFNQATSNVSDESLKLVQKKKLKVSVAPAAESYGLLTWLISAFKRHGIEIEYQILDSSKYKKTWRTLDHDMRLGITGVNSKSPAGSLLTQLEGHGGIIPDPSGEVSKLLQKAVESESGERVKVMHVISEKLMEQGNVVPLLHFGTTVVHNVQLDVPLPTPFDDEVQFSSIRWKPKSGR